MKRFLYRVGMQIVLAAAFSAVMLGVVWLMTKYVITNAVIVPVWPVIPLFVAAVMATKRAKHLDAWEHLASYCVVVAPFFVFALTMLPEGNGPWFWVGFLLAVSFLFFLIGAIEQYFQQRKQAKLDANMPDWKREKSE